MHERSDFILQTRRLGLREFAPGDERLIVELDQDPEVVRFVGPRDIELGVERVVAKALLANRASTHVMEKCGLTLESHFEEPRITLTDKRAVQYSLDRRTYLGSLRT
jgi:hypothetical protein